MAVVDVFLFDEEVLGWEDFGDRDLRYYDGSSTEGGGVGIVVGKRLSLSLEERGVEKGEGDEVGLAIHEDGRSKRTSLGPCCHQK